MSRTNGLGVVASALIGCAVVAAVAVFAAAIVRVKAGDEIIRVTGSARRSIRSDLIVWQGELDYQAPTVAVAYESIKDGNSKVVAYLTKKGINAKEIESDAIQTTPLYAAPVKGQQQSGADTYRPIVAYQLSQNIKVRSNNVDLVDQVSREVTDLIATGISFTSKAPEYYYTKLSDLKVEILADAAKDAHRRAEEITKNSGATLGQMRYAHMSPLQITPEDSMEVSAEGANDTTSINKAITAIVQMGYSIK